MEHPCQRRCWDLYVPIEGLGQLFLDSVACDQAIVFDNAAQLLGIGEVASGRRQESS